MSDRDYVEITDDSADSTSALIDSAARHIALQINKNKAATLPEKTKAFDSLIEYCKAVLKTNGKEKGDTPDPPVSFVDTRDRIRSMKDAPDEPARSSVHGR